jgi:hypothetical protein
VGLQWEVGGAATRDKGYNGKKLVGAVTGGSWGLGLQWEVGGAAVGGS